MSEPTEHLILAVDGGGTSTQLSVFNADIPNTRPLCQLTVGPTSHKAVGEASATRALQDGLIRLAGEGFMPSHFDIAVFGLSGIDTPDDEIPYRSMIAKAAMPLREKFRRTVLVSDALLPLFAEGHSCGITLIAGTGSVSMGLDSHGTLHRAGGWGYGISDMGSGQWIGAEALRSILASYDLRGEDFSHRISRESGRRIAMESDEGLNADALLAAEILRAQGIESMDRLAIWCSNMPGAAATSALARTVVHSSSPTAIKIVHRAASHLAALPIGVAKRMQSDGSKRIPVVLSGGLFGDERLRKLTIAAIKDKLGEQVKASMSGHDPAYGAAALGARILEGEAEPPLFPAMMHGPDRRRATKH